MKVGVLALQGDFAEHQAMLEKLGAEVVQVRLPGELDGLSGLILPGGESDHHRQADGGLRAAGTLAGVRARTRRLGHLRRGDPAVARTSTATSRCWA